jgi:glycerol uptake facilitator-like aquaporin
MSFARRLAAEGLGTALLLATIIGSGIMAERLAGGNAALALLCNASATGAMLVVLIWIFAPVSGAHFNPAVSLAFCLRREMTWREFAPYSVLQIAGAIAGVWLAHAMFGEAIWQISTKARDASGQWVSEAVATFGLLLTIFALGKTDRVPLAVGLYISAAYWFTASTSFANPAVTIARSVSNTFAGIAPASAPGFIGAQIVGAVIAVLFANWMWGMRHKAPA